MYETFEKLEDMLMTELNKIVEKGDISPMELENASKVVCLIEKIREMDSESEASSFNSYRRGRDSMTGQYVSRNAPRRMSRRSYENGYSGHSIKDRMIDHLESMMDEAKTDYERQTVQEWIERLEMEK